MRPLPRRRVRRGSLIWVLPAFAQSLQAGWIADPRSNCRVWKEDPQPQETIAWSGGCANRLAQGRGALQWYEAGKPNQRYEGDYRDDKRTGRGVYTYAAGSRHEGDYRDGRAHETGVLYDAASGRTYNGIWRDGCFRDGDRWAWVGPGSAPNECR